ncbi:hypothetical protein SGQ44_17400 [Flavobacterium sp. Fl-77]|uniref:Uncharacterized protein n=1 Tax=Flavobacterium flavipigmentatum TaxID=2893884 RepID=A0AAJ2SGK5_9FLAO|nr:MULTISPECIES: hypothetical protein [unclassified Flavobacterium]MDX6183984.1 hypothetical protein [Flavobacterium sp. Fl-33]MDX6187537.1 hypothetical protein [Flavobacterium sp. Fl-77]UFH38430.1 hypothetical protein LNP22_17085 [Flavobacterium sp. F-70]
MKTTLFILYLFFGFIGYSQVATKVIEVDLGKPHKKSITIYTDSLSTALDSSKWLSVRSRDVVAIKLINWNPLKHTYKIDTKELSFFNDKKKLDSIIEGIKVLVNNEIPELVLLNDSIKRIIKENENVIKSIDSLNFQVENFYEILKQKSKLVEDDYNVKRKEFLDNSKIQLGKIYSLLNDLQNIEDNSSIYSDTQKNLLETKEKSEKSIESIIQKFYTINLDIYTLPIDIQGKNIDVLEFTLHRFDKETKDEDLSFAPTPYNIWIKGGLKIDVSAGIFFTSLYDDEYDKRDDPATSGNKIIMLKNSGDYDMAFGSTINTYVRMNSWVVPTLNFGAVITQNQKLQVLLGFGAILGKQERIIFSAGISMGKVDRIADGYQVGSSYNLGDSGTIPTQSQFKFGKFFGITYNLSKVKKISLDKGIEEN